MNYLKNLVEGEAAATLSGLKLTNDNYEIALNLLRGRYDNKQLQISSRFQRLLNLNVVKDINNVKLRLSKMEVLANKLTERISSCMIKNQTFCNRCAKKGCTSSNCYCI